MSTLSFCSSVICSPEFHFEKSRRFSGRRRRRRRICTATFHPRQNCFTFAGVRSCVEESRGARNCLRSVTLAGVPSEKKSPEWWL
ncbi:hypothetical protein LIER_04738 [Lithospermum erythrorhizon]|uniref:Uncharacterized protein n=1 Tax=Lithospermum erythrorhizon TaxID=34254 RepID=A0AAV3NYS2_LITER